MCKIIELKDNYSFGSVT